MSCSVLLALDAFFPPRSSLANRTTDDEPDVELSTDRGVGGGDSRKGKGWVISNVLDLDLVSVWSEGWRTVGPPGKREERLEPTVMWSLTSVCPPTVLIQLRA
jgi:hypothetical protein